jgi:hypothetical protein
MIPRPSFHFRIDGCLRDYYPSRAQIYRRRDLHLDMASATKSVSGLIARLAHLDAALRKLLP